jgi:hypothetical protein
VHPLVPRLSSISPGVFSSSFGREYTSLSPSAALLHSHHRRRAHISGETRCLRNHCPLKVLLGMAGQSGFWRASSRDYFSRTVTSSPAYCSPSDPAHRLSTLFVDCAVRTSTTRTTTSSTIRSLGVSIDYFLSVVRSTTF